MCAVTARDVLGECCRAFGHFRFVSGPFLSGLLLGQFKPLRRPPLFCGNAGCQPCLGKLASIGGGEEASDGTTSTVHLAQTATVPEKQHVAAHIRLGCDLNLGRAPSC